MFSLTPYIEFKGWGNQFLAQVKGLKENQPIGETWEYSLIPQKSSLTERGSLRELKEKKELNLNDFLVKFISTSDNLSIQVHPNKELAQKFENGNGKDECWLILDHEPGAKLYMGLKDNIQRDKLTELIKAGDHLELALQEVEVKKGDFYYIPAGTIHAIGKGITLLEIQESSDITYRVWDWNREPKRELHIEKGLDCIQFSKEFNDLSSKLLFRDAFSSTRVLLSHESFNVENFSFEDVLSLSVSSRPLLIINLLEPINIKGHKQLSLSSYSSCLLSEPGEYLLSNKGKNNIVVVK